MGCKICLKEFVAKNWEYKNKEIFDNDQNYGGANGGGGEGLTRLGLISFHRELMCDSFSMNTKKIQISLVEIAPKFYF